MTKYTDEKDHSRLLSATTYPTKWEGEDLDIKVNAEEKRASDFPAG
jgi:hypothetical protein